MSNPNPPDSGQDAAKPDARAPLWFLCLAIVALAGYGAFLASQTSIYAAGADSSGYLNSARLLAAGRLQTDLRTPPEFGPQAELLRPQFQPHGFVPFPGNPRLSPTYAVGLPLHLALAGRILGWRTGPLAVIVLAALGALVLCYAVARELGLHRWPAAAATVALAAYPVFIFTSIQPLSDTLATTWCLAAVFAALRARRHAGWAAACGVALALAVLVRVTDIVLLPALVVLLGLDGRRLALAALGGLPGALWLAYYQHALYGSALQSGYVNISETFGVAYGLPTVVHFVKWLALFLPAVLLVLPFVAAARRDTRTRELLALALWFGAIAGVYSFYVISHEVWWCLRFILPGTPALILAGLLGAEALARSLEEKSRRFFCRAAVPVLMAWAAGGGWFWTTRLNLLLTKGYEQAYADAATAASTRFPPGALVVCSQLSGALYYYTDFPVLRWDFVNGGEFARFCALTRESGRPVCAVLFASEEHDALQEHCAGEWTRLGTVKNIALWRLTGAPRSGPKQ